MTTTNDNTTFTVGTLYETTETFILEPVVETDVFWIRYNKGSMLLLVHFKTFDEHARFTFLDSKGVLGHCDEYFVTGRTASQLRAVQTP